MASVKKPTSSKLLLSLLVCFFVSGFCALLYQSVWLRLAFASFGINAQIISIVLSVFMAGLGLGSVSANKIKELFDSKSSFGALRIYATAELFIGLGSVTVPKLFIIGNKLLSGFNQT